MSDPLDMPRRAAAEMMASAADTAFGTVSATIGGAAERAMDALASAKTQDEITLIRDRFVSGCANMGGTVFVSRR